MPTNRTYRDIFDEFKESTKVDAEMIGDYRPFLGAAASNFLHTNKPGIIIWLKDGSTIIYISKE